MTAKVIYLNRPKKINFIDCTEGARKVDVLDAISHFSERIVRAESLHRAKIYDFKTKFEEENEAMFELADALDVIYGRDA